jgi:hypothetical protein
MTLSANQKKWLHAILMGFITGALTAAQVVLATGFTSKAALVGAAAGILGGGVARVAGVILARIEQPATPPPAIIP